MSLPAEPSLASTELSTLRSKTNSRKRKRAGTSCSIIDDALRGGFEHGHISCISGEKGTGKTTISLHLLSTYLLSSPDSQAAVIDTTGTFDVLRLHQVIVQCLQAQGVSQKPHHSDIQDNADDILNRVRIMRVFDFVGVSEAINELRAEIQPAPAIALEQREEVPPLRGTIPDSEDEDDEMLFDIEQQELLLKTQEKDVDPTPGNIFSKLGFILIDNIAHVVNPLLKTNYAQGQALFTTFMRSLSHLTASHDLLAILINTAVTPRSAYEFQAAPTTAPPSTMINDPTARLPSFLDHPSIFAASSVRPALGKPFTYFLDLHLLLAVLPKRRRDSEIVYGGKAGKAEFVNVVEVLSDRMDGRTGRWAAFVIEKGVGLKAAF